MSSWSDLHSELISMVSERLTNFIDYVRFRAVCRSWRSSTSHHTHQPFLPYLMVPAEDRCIPLLYDLYLPSGVALGQRLRIPETASAFFFLWRFIGSSYSWLAFFDNQGDIFLFNPFTKAKVLLPPRSKAVVPIRLRLSSPDPVSDPDCIATVIFDVADDSRYFFVLAYARTGDSCWNYLNCLKQREPYEDIAFHDGKIFALRSNQSLVAVDINSPNSEKVEIIPALAPLYGTKYLFCLPSGELCQVVKNVDKIDRTVELKVSKLQFDSKGMTWANIKSLGEWTIFICSGTSFAIRSSDVGDVFRANSVYFSQCVFGLSYAYLASYRLDDHRMEPHFKGSHIRRGPIWIVPHAS